MCDCVPAFQLFWYAHQVQGKCLSLFLLASMLVKVVGPLSVPPGLDQFLLHLYAISVFLADSGDSNG